MTHTKIIFDDATMSLPHDVHEMCLFYSSIYYLLFRYSFFGGGGGGSSHNKFCPLSYKVFQI